MQLPGIRRGRRHRWSFRSRSRSLYLASARPTGVTRPAGEPVFAPWRYSGESLKNPLHLLAPIRAHCLRANEALHPHADRERTGGLIVRQFGDKDGVVATLSPPGADDPAAGFFDHGAPAFVAVECTLGFLRALLRPLEQPD